MAHETTETAIRIEMGDFQSRSENAQPRIRRTPVNCSPPPPTSPSRLFVRSPPKPFAYAYNADKKTTASGILIGKSRWRSNHDVGRLEIRLATRRTHAMPTSCGHGSRKDWGLAGSHACGQAAGNANRKPCPHCLHAVNHHPMVACLPRRSARPSFVMTHAVIIRMAITSSSQRAPVNGKFAKTTFRTP